MQDRTGARGWDEETPQLKEGVRCLCSLPSSVSGNVRVCWRWNGNGCCGQVWLTPGKARPLRESGGRGGSRGREGGREGGYGGVDGAVGKKVTAGPGEGRLGRRRWTMAGKKVDSKRGRKDGGWQPGSCCEAETRRRRRKKARRCRECCYLQLGIGREKVEHSDEGWLWKIGRAKWKNSHIPLTASLMFRAKLACLGVNCSSTTAYLEGCSPESTSLELQYIHCLQFQVNCNLSGISLTTFKSNKLNYCLRSSVAALFWHISLFFPIVSFPPSTRRELLTGNWCRKHINWTQWKLISRSS